MDLTLLKYKIYYIQLQSNQIRWKKRDDSKQITVFAK